jgi:hypothetical protein
VTDDELDPSMQLDVLAAMLLADRREGGDLLDHLATKLGGAFPEWTKIERDGWILSSVRHVRRLTLDLGSARYRIVREAHGPVARHVKVVGGVEIGSKQMPVDAWVAAVIEAVQALSAQNDGARRALDRLVRGD